MIQLCYQNNRALVYSVADWRKLREEYRIVGSLIGGSPAIPALPLILLPEEVCLLVNKNLATLVQYPQLQDVSAQSTHSKEYQNIQDSLLQAEQTHYKETRKKDLENLIDKIIKGKKRKSDNNSLQTRQEVLEEELNKATITEETMLWPIFTESFKSSLGQPVQVPLSNVLEQTTPTKCAVYADLWGKGYYVTSGIKFSGDFLVYLGDPIVYHAVFIVRCVENPNKEQHTTEIIAFGRLGNSVKKKPVLASLDDNKSISYITLAWLDN